MSVAISGESLTSSDANSALSFRVGSPHLFVVIGTQRTGTNILREILNTNDFVAMLGEVLSPSPAPAHWENFCRSLPARSVHPASMGEAEVLLDRYFKFVRYRILNHWEGKKKSHSYAFGVDVKYNQLTPVEPANMDFTISRFILGYLRSREAILIHTTRNVIHSAISALIASQRNLWHNYDGAVIDRTYYIDVGQCLAHARMIIRHRDAFLEAVHDCTVVDCVYESLIDDIRRAGFQEEIPDGPGPLRNIAAALGSAFKFRYDRRLQKAINIPYSRLIANYDALIKRLKDSEFWASVPTLE
jgi:LPS sulfotransferase NodH